MGVGKGGGGGRWESGREGGGSMEGGRRGRRWE